VSYVTVFKNGLIEDSYLDQVNPTLAFGAVSVFRIGSISARGSGLYNAWHGLHAVTTAPTSGPNIPSNAHIVSATLTMHTHFVMGTSVNVKTRAVLENLVSPAELQTTWNLDETGGVSWSGGSLYTDVSTETSWFTPISSSSDSVVDITEQVKYCFDNFSGYISLLSGFKGSVTNDYCQYFSSNWTDLSTNPEIEIIWEPATPINDNTTLIVSGPLTITNNFPLFINTGHVPKTGVLDLSVRSPWHSCSWAEQRSPWNDYTSMTWENWCGISGAGINATGINLSTSGTVEIQSSGNFPLYINPIESTGSTSGFLDLFTQGPIDFSGLFPLFLKTDLVPSGTIPLSIKGATEDQSGFIFVRFKFIY